MTPRKRKPWSRSGLSFYKQHRAILDSDIIHLRRPDGRDWDGWLHVNPTLPERALAIFYNPLDEPIERQVHLTLYYTGLTEKAIVHREDGTESELTLDRSYHGDIEITIPARGRTWITLREP